MGNRHMVKLQAPTTLGGSTDICSLAVDTPSPSSQCSMMPIAWIWKGKPLHPPPPHLNYAHCMEMGKGRKKSPQPAPYTLRMPMFATGDMDLD